MEVPQGSVLAVVLFNLLINYLKLGVCIVVAKFADDPKLFSMVNSKQTLKSGGLCKWATMRQTKDTLVCVEYIKGILVCFVYMCGKERDLFNQILLNFTHFMSSISFQVLLIVRARAFVNIAFFSSSKVYIGVLK